MADRQIISFGGLMPREFGRFERNVAQKLRLGHQKALRRAGKKVETELRRKSMRIRDRGTYQRGWRTRALFNRLDVGNIAGHERYVEFGRRPNNTMPPVDVIEEWAQRKLGVVGAGWAIARKIAQQGIRARPVLRSLRTQARLSGIVRKSLMRAWDELLRTTT